MLVLRYSTVGMLQTKWQRLQDQVAAQAAVVAQLQTENKRLAGENGSLKQLLVPGKSTQLLSPSPCRQVCLPMFFFTLQKLLAQQSRQLTLAHPIVESSVLCCKVLLSHGTKAVLHAANTIQPRLLSSRCSVMLPDGPCIGLLDAFHPPLANHWLQNRQHCLCLAEADTLHGLSATVLLQCRSW